MLYTAIQIVVSLSVPEYNSMRFWWLSITPCKNKQANFHVVSGRPSTDYFRTLTYEIPTFRFCEQIKNKLDPTSCNTA